MSEGFPYADIVILALIAGFILLRLRGVLGQKMDDDTPKEYKNFLKQQDDSPVVQLSEQIAKEKEEEEQKDSEILSSLESSETKDGIADIKQADKDFTLTNFLTGAQGAFEMVFDAFNKEDRDTLNMLLAPELKKLFLAELDRISEQDTYEETTLLAIESAEVVKASLVRNLARITVKFVSEQTTVTRDKEGSIVEGDPARSHLVEDEWTFERQMNSRNPNWKIIDT